MAPLFLNRLKPLSEYAFILRKCHLFDPLNDTPPLMFYEVLNWKYWYEIYQF